MDLKKIRTPSIALGLILVLAATAPAHAQKRGPEEHRSPRVLIFDLETSITITSTTISGLGLSRS